MKHLRVPFFICLFTVLSALCAQSAFAGRPSHDMPDMIDPAGNYLFFIHNYYVETKGPDGDCKYRDILQAFAKQGFTVISEIRTGKIIPCTYSEKIVIQVKTLLDAGVPPGNIVVSGHSKGGAITLCVASQLKNPDVKFVVMAGCGIPGIIKYKLYPDFTKLQGNILSIYAGSDNIAGSCGDAFSKASNGLDHTEIKIESNGGHRLFFAPDETWLRPVLDWIKATR